MKSVYYGAYPLTLYFQEQFITIHSMVNAKTAIKCLLKKEQVLVKWSRDLNAKKIKYHDDRAKKRQTIQKIW